MSDGSEADGSSALGSLVAWLQDQDLLRGPFLFTDYWASVLGLRASREDPRRGEGLVDYGLFRAGLDRPDLEVPRLRHYLLLFLAGPFLLPFRRFRRLGRYRLSYRSELGEEVLDRLRSFELDIREREDGRVDVSCGDRELATGLLPPGRTAGFTSLFHATYKLPLASLTAILLAAIALPVLHETAGFETALDLWVPVVFPLLAALLWLVYRDLVTAVVGALPVVVARYLVPVLQPGAGGGWGELFLALGGLFLLYLLVDWFFMPRPVPPVLMLYTSRGPGRAYPRREDAPWWLDGESYWVWRYLVLTPAELNKFWERDWERIELWVRADGPEAGDLEWVVTDAHYRELWIPWEKLGHPSRLERLRERAGKDRRQERAGFWLLEVDANLVFHTPFVRAVSYVPEHEEGLPARSVGHLIGAFWKQAEADDPDPYRPALERMQLRLGRRVFRDTPEVASRLVARHLLAQPWRYWRYPLGAATRRAQRVYGPDGGEGAPAAAEPELQIKAEEADP